MSALGLHMHAHTYTPVPTQVKNVHATDTCKKKKNRVAMEMYVWSLSVEKAPQSFGYLQEIPCGTSGYLKSPKGLLRLNRGRMERRD